MKKSSSWIKFKKTVVLLLSKQSLFKNIVLYIWRYNKWIIIQIKREIYKLLRKHNYLDLDKLYYINPKKIKFCSQIEFDIYNFKGKIIKGNWDLTEKEFEKLDIYVALKEVLLYGGKWQNTFFYKNILCRLMNGEILWNCSNVNELNNRCKYLETLFFKIRESGYRNQSELLKNKNNYNPSKIDDEITVNIGRYGDILFSNCAHRLAIAKLLNINKVPVKIAVRHPMWMSFKKEVLQYAFKHGGVYQPITHPDLNDIPAFHKSEDRFNIIRENLTQKRGKLLDIGANWGYFCHKFENEGFNCFAVENDLENIYFLKKIKRAERRNFYIIDKSLLDEKRILNNNYNVVLALNIFHHFLKRSELYNKFKVFLNKLKVNEMFFEPHNYNEPQMKHAYINYTNEGFINFILNNSILNKSIFLRQVQDGRKIYRLFREK